MRGYTGADLPLTLTGPEGDCRQGLKGRDNRIRPGDWMQDRKPGRDKTEDHEQVHCHRVHDGQVSYPYAGIMVIGCPGTTPHYIMSGAPLRVPYVQDNIKITFPGNEPGLKETLITIMEISTTGDAEDRVAALEKRVRDMDALVRGLTAELLDLKSVAMAMTRDDRERSRQEIRMGNAVQSTISPVLADLPESTTPDVPADDRTVIRPKGAGRQDEPVAMAEPAMVRIMQSDGTMKLEPRYGNKRMI